jgi:Fe-S-cluster containining protein
MRAEARIRHFACTQCGKCCNRSPEVELSEAAGLSDVFVFRLMFRLYWLPDQAGDYRRSGQGQPNRTSVFFEKKRLLNTFAARKYSAKAMRDGKRIAYTKYLLISALAVETIEAACSALSDSRCSIYDRRPLTCRSVPLHYSRAEARAAFDLETFVGTSGYRCDTSDAAPIILEDGRIVAPEIGAARSDAIALAARDRPWSEAIVRRMSDPVSSSQSLPSIEEIESSAALGAMTVPMREAWQVAADIGLMTRGERDGLIELQLGTIRRQLASGRCSRDALETLRQMEVDYSSHTNGGCAIPMKL